MKIQLLTQSAIVVMGLLATGIAPLESELPTGDQVLVDNTVWEVEASNTGERWGGPSGEAPAGTEREGLSPELSPMLAPGTIALCNAGFGETVVQSMNSARDGTVRMKCGDSRSGYVHIRLNHESSWTSAMVGPGVWDDFMMFATVNAVEAPSRTVTKPGSKRCYTTPIKLYKWVNGVRVYVKTMNPTVLISTNNKIVITSIPTSTSSC